MAMPAERWRRISELFDGVVVNRRAWLAGVLDPNPVVLVSGQRLGNYGVLAPLGAGGMGEVYRARDLGFRREVALKTLRHAFTADPDRLARFEREARMHCFDAPSWWGRFRDTSGGPGGEAVAA